LRDPGLDGGKRRGLHQFIPSLGPVFKSNHRSPRLGRVGEQTLGDKLREGRSVLESLGPLTLQHGSLGVDLLPFPSRQKLSFALSGPALGKGMGVNEQLF
uniref:Uncharacterized protein n=1 Tax=Rhinopithecus roxellana TaxID=61622 RepID=A0A2K6P0W3_RHIRO